MFTCGTILVPVDRSDFAREALARAALLARSSDATLLILHVLQPPMPRAAYWGPLDKLDDVYQETAHSAKMYFDTLKPLVEGVKHAWLIRLGNPGQAIVDCASEVGADIIVMGTHGRSGLSRLVLGSTAEQVMRHASVPVLTWQAANLVTPVGA